jgi:hypothetical protein
MVSIKYTVIEKYGTKFSMYSGPCMLRGGALAAGDTCGDSCHPIMHPMLRTQHAKYCPIVEL